MPRTRRRGCSGRIPAASTSGIAPAQRVADFLDIDIDPRSVAERLFRDDAFSFFKGQIGSWRKAFTSEHESLFHNRFGHVLEAYGYK